MKANLKGWRYVLTYGYDLDLYAKGNKRIGVARGSGEIIIQYEV